MCMCVCVCVCVRVRVRVRVCVCVCENQGSFMNHICSTVYLYKFDLYEN